MALILLSKRSAQPNTQREKMLTHVEILSERCQQAQSTEDELAQELDRLAANKNEG
jgi:hypothetical protein